MSGFVEALPLQTRAYGLPETSASSDARVLQTSWSKSVNWLLERATASFITDADRHPLTREVASALHSIQPARAAAIRSLLEEFVTALPVEGAVERTALRLTEADDGAILVEWLFKDRRLGFSFEPDARESGWYFVLSNASAELAESGLLDGADPKLLITRFLQHA